MKNLKRTLVASLIISQSIWAEDLRPSKMLLNTFSGQCPQVVTRDVSGSLINIDALNGLVQELKKDPECNGMEELSKIITRYSMLYEDFETRSSENQNRLSLEKKIADFSLMVSDPNWTPEQLLYLQNEMVIAQSDLVNVNAGLVRFNNLSGREAKGANQLLMSVNSFMENMNHPTNSACFKKHGAQISSLLSNVLLTTAAFAAPGTSLALAAGSVVVSTVGNYVADFKSNRVFDKAYDIEMPTALRCVSQVLTENYCSSEGTKLLIEEKINNESKNLDQFEGINLLTYDVTSLSKWLEEVFSGSQITSQGDLINREKPILQYEFLKKVKRYLETYSTLKRTAFLNIENEKDRSVAIAQSISGMAQIMSEPSINPVPQDQYGRGGGSGGDFENPIWVSNSKALMPFNLWKPGAVTSVPTCGFSSCSLTDFLNQKGETLTINNWDEAYINASRVIQTVIDRVSLERAKTISVDAFTILVNAKRELRGETNAYNGLIAIRDNADRISNYLNALGCKKSNDCIGYKNYYYPQISNILKTKDLTVQVLKLIDEALIPRSIAEDSMPEECKKTKDLAALISFEDESERKSFQVSSCISKILKLEERGTDVFFTKVRNMVAYELEARLANDDLGNGIDDIIYTTKGDLIQSILNSYSNHGESISLGELQVGLESAENNAKQTFEVFYDYFKDDFINSLKSEKLTNLEKKDLCFRSLPVFKFAKQNELKDLYELCKDSQMNVYKNGPTIKFLDYVKKVNPRGLKASKIELNSELVEANYFCDYSDYHQRNKLIDEMLKRTQRRNRR